MPVAAPADRRFRRSRVKPGRRRPWYARAGRVLRVLLPLLLVVAGGLYGARAAATADVLHVDTIRIRGNKYLDSGEVQALLAGLRGQHLLLADLSPWRRRVLGSPWVADAALRRVLPSTIEVVLRERTPMAIARIQGALYLVDEGGMVIDEYGPQYARFNLPIVDGLARTEDNCCDPARTAVAARLLADVRTRPALAERVSMVDVSNPRDAVVLLERDPALLHVGDTDFRRRLESYVELADALRERVPAIEYVDLRFGDRLYVRPARERRTGAAQP